MVGKLILVYQKRRVCPSIGDAFQDFMNASLQEKGRLLGKMGGEALGSKGIGKAGSAAKGKLLASGKMPSGGQLPGGLPDDPCPPKKVPGRPFTGKEAPDKAYKHLEKFHGVNPNDASERLHRIKEKSGLNPLITL